LRSLGEGKSCDQYSLPCFPFLLTGVGKALLLAEIAQPLDLPWEIPPKPSSAGVPEQQSVLNSSALKLLAGLRGEFLKKQFAGSVLEN